MIGLVGLYFHLGLYIGLHTPLLVASSNMFGYLLCSRYSHFVFNPKLSILLIRRVSLFMLLAHKFNYSILPVVNGFITYSLRRFVPLHRKTRLHNYASSTFLSNFKHARFITSYRRLMARLSANPKRVRLVGNSAFASLIPCYRSKLRRLYCKLFDNCKYESGSASLKHGRHSHIKRSHIKPTLNGGSLQQSKHGPLTYSERILKERMENEQMQRKLERKALVNRIIAHNQVILNNYILQFFYRYALPILPNIVNLTTNWHTYYDNVCAYLFDGNNRTRMHVLFRGSTRNRFRRRSRWSLHYFKKMLKPRQFLRVYMTLLLRIYQRLSFILRQAVDKQGFFLINRKRFRKFYIFIKILLYLRQFRVLPNILFYLESSSRELIRISKYRICIISLVDSDSTGVNCVTYPIPCSFGNYLSKIFYSHLIINSFFLGRILMLLNSIDY